MARRARHITAFCATLLISLLLLTSGSATAQEEIVAWQRAGTPPQGAWQMAADPASPGTLYALNSSGIQRSTDSGATWAECNREARSLSLVAPLPGQEGPTRLYATTTGALRASDDGCATWRDLPAGSIQPSSGYVQQLIPYPNNPQVLYASMGGLGGLYRSTDGGASWQGASGGLPPGARVKALTADPAQPSTIYAGVSYAANHHPPAYLFKSSDGGLSWRSSSLGMRLLPNNGGEISGLAWSGGTLFAATARDGLFASADRGTTWSAATMPRSLTTAARRTMPGTLVEPLPLRIGSLAATPEGALLMQTDEGLYLSLDGAGSWRAAGPRDAPPGGQLVVSVAFRRAVLYSASGIWSADLPQFEVTQPTVATSTPTQAAPTPPPTSDPNTPTPTFTPTSTPTNTPVPTATPTLVPGPHPSDRVGPADPANSDYFEPTGHNVRFGFRDWFRTNGGVGFLGYPLTEEFAEGGVPVQYFERGRLEYRNGQVGLARLGAELTQGRTFAKPSPFPSTDTNVFFDVTGYSVSGPFLTAWRNFGGLRTLGYPLSESFFVGESEFQWFERGRLEFQPFLPESQRIVLGQIGKEALQKKGWIR